RASISSLFGESNEELGTGKRISTENPSTSIPTRSIEGTIRQSIKPITLKSLDDDDTSILQGRLVGTRDERSTYDTQPDTELIRLVGTSQTARSKLSRIIVRRLQPHFDVLFGLTPPFLSTMYGTDNSNVRNERPLLLSLHYSAIRNSYILTLISMMAWSVTYRSWLSFILLLSACILWIMPNSRLACLYASPAIALCAIVLILIQYMFGMNLPSQELPQSVTPDGLRLSELGMQRWENSIGALSLQITFLICFWLTLRLFVMDHSVNRLIARLSTERFYLESRGNSPAPSFSSVNVCSSPWAKAFNRSPANCRLNVSNFRFSLLDGLLRGLFSLPNDVISSDRGTTAASLSFALPLGTVDNTAYRKFSELKDIGLETFHSAALFQRLLTPVIFLVVIILQVHYFHEPFLTRSALDRFR
ncbi:Piezo-type mechanosensitive ion channel component, partial [Fasciolopsis buskii]